MQMEVVPCLLSAVSEKRPMHVLSAVPVESRLSCPGEPIHGVSVPEAKPCQLHRRYREGSGWVR